MITVKVPASTGNVGPGFDVLGLALTLYNEISFEESGDTLDISGCPEKFANEDNIAYKAFCETLAYKGLKAPKGLKIVFKSDIPICRGLGSSSTLIVGGIIGANAVCNLGLSKNEMLFIANKLEGHPDNAAPAIFGGLIASSVNDGEVYVADYKVNEELKFTALVPDFETSTEKAREMLPENIKRTDAVYTVGCLALLLKAFECADKKLLAAALDDKLHQPYRKQLIPGFDDIRKLAIANGADGLIISGSGSTLLAVGGPKDFEDKMAQGLKAFAGNWRVLSLKADLEGAKVINQD